MDTDESWVTLGQYSDEVEAKTLAHFLTSAKVPCRIGNPNLIGAPAFNVFVPRHALGDISRVLSWTVVAEYRDLVSATVVAGQLCRESIPSRVEGGTLSRPPGYGQPPGPFQVSAPRTLLERAKQILHERPVSDEELTRLALSQPLEDSEK